MGNKISLPGDCRGKKKSRNMKRTGPTRWQDAGDMSERFVTQKRRTLSMELSLELMEIENQIQRIISLDENKRTKEHLKELKKLIKYKELKTKEYNNPNGSKAKKLCE